MYACASSFRTLPTSSGCSRNQRALRVIVRPPVTPGGPSRSTSIVTDGGEGSRPIWRATSAPCSSTSPSAHRRIRSRSRRLKVPRDPSQLAVDRGRASQHVARPIAGTAIPVGDVSARLLDQEAARSDVPRREPEFEEAVEDPARGPGQIETRCTGPAEILESLERSRERGEVSRKPVLPAEGESRPDHSLPRRTLRHAARFRCPAARFPDRSSATRRMPRIAQERRVGRPCHRDLVLHERNGYADGGETVEEVGRAIQRIDDPSKAFGHSPRLLAEHRDVRCFLVEERPDRRLAREVDLGDPIPRESFGLTLRGPSSGADDFAAHERGSSSGGAHPFEVDRHGGTLPTELEDRCSATIPPHLAWVAGTPPTGLSVCG